MCPCEPTVLQKRVTLCPFPPDPRAVGAGSPEARGEGRRGGHMKKGGSLGREEAFRPPTRAQCKVSDKVIVSWCDRVVRKHRPWGPGGRG